MKAAKRTRVFPVEPILWLLIGQSIPSSHGAEKSDELVCFLLDRARVNVAAKTALYCDARKILVASAEGNPEIQKIFGLLGELPDVETMDPNEAAHWLYRRLHLFNAEHVVPITI